MDAAAFGDKRRPGTRFDDNRCEEDFYIR